MTEDGAGGVVTLIEGLGSDVVVTVVNRQEDPLGGRQASKPRLAVKPFSSPRTSTPTITDNCRGVRFNRPTPSGKDRYTSTYQVAHCNANPTSCYSPVSEFPPQRLTPSVNEGNFQIGGYVSYPDAKPTITASHIRRGLTRPDRGSVFSSRSPREMEAFANSLRKYPSSSPDRSISRELVEKLLKLTQAKHSQKTPTTKNTRFLRNNYSSDRRSSRKQSRDTETHTRAPDKVKHTPGDINTARKRSGSRARNRDYGTDVRDVSRSGVQRETRRTGRIFRVGRESRSTSVSPMYDYLRAGRTPTSLRQPCPNAKQQRLKHISREVRSVIKQMNHNRPAVFQVCPKIQKRLIHHKKNCPVQNEIDEDMSADKRDEGCQGPCASPDELMPKLFRFLETISDRDACSSVSDTNRSGDCKLRLSRLFEDCFNCQEPSCSNLSKCKLPKGQKCCSCPIAPKRDDTEVQAKSYDSAASKSTETKVDCSCCVQPKRKNDVDCACDLEPKAKSVVIDARQSGHKDKNDVDCACYIEPKAKSVVIDAHQSRHKDKNYVDCECYVKPKSKNDVECACETQFKAKHSCECDILSDEEYYKIRIDEEVAKWLSEVPVQVNESPENKQQREDMVRGLAETLKQLPDNNDFEENAKNDIEKCVNNMPIWKPSSMQVEQQLRKQLSDDLHNRIMDIPRHPDRLKDTVKRFLDDINFEDDVNTEEVTDNIVNKLKNLAVNAPKGDDEFEKQITSEIVETLTELPIKYGADKNVESDRLARSLASKVIGLLRNLDENLNDKFKKNITDWLEEVGQIIELPADKETEDITNNLAAKLNELQSPGMNETDRNNMEREIEKVLKNLNVLDGKMNYLTEGLMDTVTDTIHAVDKGKFERKQEQEALAETRDWLKDVQGVDALDPIEKNELTKKIAAKITNDKDNDVSKNRDAVQDTLKQAGINVSPSSVGKLHDKVKNKLKNLPDKVQKDNIKESTRKHLNAAIDELNIPEDKKSAIKDKFSDVLAKRMEAPVVTKKEIDEMKESVLEATDAIIEDTHIPKSTKEDLKQKVDAILDKNFEKLLSTTDKDQVKYTLLKEINYVIDKEPILDEEKDDLKYKFKHMLSDNLDKPYSSYLLETINDDIDDIIEEAELEENTKSNLKNKLTNIADEVLNELPKQTMKEHVKNKTTKSMNSVIDKTELQEDVKDDLKRKFNTMLKDNMAKQYSDQVKNDVLDSMNKIIDESPIPKSDKDELLKKLTNVVGKNLDELPPQTAVDHKKELITTDLNDLMDDIGLPKEQQKHVKKDLGRTIAEHLDRPFGIDQKNKLNETVKDILAKSDIPSDKKIALPGKVDDIITKNLDGMPYQTPAEFAKDKTHREIMRVINAIPGLDGEKKEKELAKFDDVIERSFNNKYLSDVRKDLHEGIRDTIRENSSLSPDKQKDVMNEVKANVSRILDESYYEDHAREYRDNINDMIDKAPIRIENKDALKRRVKNIIDDNSQNPDFTDVINVVKDGLRLIKVASDQSLGKQKSDETVKKDLIKTISETPIPSDTKNQLVSKINTLMKSNKSNDFSEVMEELENTVDGLPIFSIDKRALKSKLAMALPTETDKYKANNKVTTNLPIQVLDKSKTEEKMIARTNRAIDEAPIRQHLKDDLKSQLKSVISDILIQPSPLHAKEVMKKGVNKIIYELPLTEYQKNDLKLKLIDLLIKELDRSRDLTEHQKNSMQVDIINIVDEAQLPKAKKTELNKRFQEAISANFNMTPSADAKNKMKQSLLDIIEDTVMPRAEKKKLKAKMEKVVDKFKMEAVTQRTGFDKRYQMDEPDAASRDLYAAVDRLHVPNDQKIKIKETIKNILQENSPYSEDSISLDKKFEVKNKLSKVLNGKNGSSSGLPSYQASEDQAQTTKHEVADLKSKLKTLFEERENKSRSNSITQPTPESGKKGARMRDNLASGSSVSSGPNTNLRQSPQTPRAMNMKSQNITSPVINENIDTLPDEGKGRSDSSKPITKSRK